MSRPTSLLLAGAVLTAVTAAATPGLLPGDATPTATAASKAPSSYQGYPRPAVTGKQLADRAITYSSDHPLRITGSPTQLTATTELADELEALGYAVEVKAYNGVLQAIEAVKKGTTKPAEHLVFGAHFDSFPLTVEGTYDNGTGTAMVLGLARAFAKVPTRRTLVFTLYNGEEEGALASAEHADEYAAAGRKVTAYLGFDMVGIAWPVGVETTDDYCLCLWRGARDTAFDQLLDQVNHGFLKMPRGKRLVSIEGRNVRNSDEASWADAGYPTLRWAGMRTASAYPEYHLPQDNAATIDATAGGRQFFEAGLRNTLLSAYYTAAALDARR